MKEVAEIELWNTYVKKTAFNKRLIPQNFIGGVIPTWLSVTEERYEKMQDLTFKDIRPEFKKVMTKSAYEALLSAFRTYKYKEVRDLVNITINRRALVKLNIVTAKLGIDENDDSISGAIDWLTSPDVRREDETSQALFNASNTDRSSDLPRDQPETFLNKARSLRQRMCADDMKLLDEMLANTYANGWIAKKGIRSNEPSRIREQLDKDALYNITKFGGEEKSKNKNTYYMLPNYDLTDE